MDGGTADFYKYDRVRYSGPKVACLTSHRAQNCMLTVCWPTLVSCPSLLPQLWSYVLKILQTRRILAQPDDMPAIMTPPKKFSLLLPFLAPSRVPSKTARLTTPTRCRYSA